MKFITKHFYTVFVASMAILCAASAGTAFWAVRRAEGMNAALVQERIYEFKRTFLRDTVRNMIRDIDRLRDYNLRRAREDLDPLTDEAWADRETKATIADVIRAKSFEHDGYIWVNEVLDWSGGDGYAVRRVHPNLVDTEGCLLSTKATDIKGNTPYLTELEGVREHGELFSRYYFKRMGSDEVAEKLTYAALYPDYDWIVAMGMHVDDIDTYTLAVREAASEFNARVIALVVALLVLFFGLGVALLIVAGRRFMDASARAIRTEANIDPLTGALNRRIGDRYFSDAFRAFRYGKPSPLVLSIDLDDFKRVNDAYGHDAGDVVLRAVVERVKQTMRASDFLFRWGGEEFLLAYSGVSPDEAARLADRLNRAVASTPIRLRPADPAGSPELVVSVSVGVSWFGHADGSYADAIGRCDRALYRAKAAGKDRAFVEPPGA